MAIAQVQLKQLAVFAAAPQTTTFTSAPTNGNLLIACAMSNTTTTAAITSASGSWTQAFSASVKGNAHRVSVYYRIAGASEASAIVATAASSSVDVTIFEYSGMAASSPLDQTAVSVDVVTTVTSRSTGTTSATTQASELAIAALDVNTWAMDSWSNSFVAQSDGQRIHTAAKILSATGTVETTATYTAGGASNAGGGIATFKAVATATRNSNFLEFF